MRIASKITLAAAALAIFSAPAFAASDTSNMTVSATVSDACTVVVVTGVDFGVINGKNDATNAVPGKVQVFCTSDKASGVQVTMDGGKNAASGQRYMKTATGGNTMPYNLFLDSGRTSSIAEGGDIYNGGITTLNPKNIDIYGTVPAGQYPVGTYLDDITVTVNY